MEFFFTIENPSCPCACGNVQGSLDVTSRKLRRVATKVALRAKPPLKAETNLVLTPTGLGPTGFSPPMLGLDLSAARLADEERPVRRALVVLPPRAT